MTDCPICLNKFSEADIIYPLKCRTKDCEYNYCSDCIENFRKSASDGYQVASDGSRQVKIQVQCPQCREKYQCKKYPSDVIVGSVLMLRKAASIEDTLLGQSDSELSATELGSKHEFLKSTSMEELQDAVRRLQVYQEEIGETENPVPELDWELWRPVVRATRPAPDTCVSPKASKSHEEQEEEDLPPWRDPSLFYGLDELMTIDEQEFVTSLLTSGHTQSLMQAAQILHGILDMAVNRSALPPQQRDTYTARQRQQRKPKPVNPQRMQKIRKKYPLPSRMPQCVKLDTYDPDGSHSPFKFESSKMTCLVLNTVKGPAGRSGLRRGDMVTHVNGDVVQTKDEYNAAVKQEMASAASEFWLTVNADMEIANELYKRAKKMQQDKVNFYATG